MISKLQAWTTEDGSLAGQGAEVIYTIIVKLLGVPEQKHPHHENHVWSQPIALMGGEGEEDLARSQRKAWLLSVPALLRHQLPWSAGVRNCEARGCLGPCEFRSGSEVSNIRGSGILPGFCY